MVADRPQWSDAELVRAASSDDPEAFGALFERWFDRVYDVARNIVRNDDTAAEVAQDVFLTSWQRIGQLDDPERFGGWLLRASRNRALNRLEKERRAQPLEGDVMTGLHESRHGGTGDRDDLVGSNRLLETDAISEARDQQSLVWAAAAALGERDVSLLDLQLRHQLSPAEIADELGVTANNAHQLLFRLRNKLGDAVANHQVWRDGAPRCDELAALVDGDPFDASTNKIVQRHAARCEICGPERERVVDPAKLFAAVPIAIAPPFVRDQAAAALAAEGVPVEPPSGPDGDAPGGEADTGQPDDHADPGQGSAGGSETTPDPDQLPSGDAAGSTGSATAPADPAPTDPAPANPAPTAAAPAPAGPAPAAPVLASSAEPSVSTERRSSRRRRLAFALVASVVLVGLVVALARPAGDVDLATGPTSSDVAGDVADDDELATTPTTEAPTTAVPTTEPPTTATPTTEPPTTRPPSTEPPSTQPPSTEPPVTEPPSTQPPPTPSPPTDPPPPPPPPVIVRFILSTPGGAIFCPNSTDTARTARWFTEETTSVTVTTPNGTTSGGFEGTHTFCAPIGSSVTLTASGPGGTVSETETIS